MSVICLPGVVQLHDGALISAKSDDVVVTAVGPIRLSVFRDIRLAENAWRMLQSKSTGVPEQSYEWAKAWTRHTTQGSGNNAAIVCGRSQTGEIHFIWPFEVVIQKGLRCLQWIGQSRANHNMGLNSLKFSRGVSASDVKALLSRAAKIIGNVSAAYFINQPDAWNGKPNPLKLLSHLPSARQRHMLLLDRDYDTLYRNRFSGKSRNQIARQAREMSKLGVVEFGWAQSDAERYELLDVCFQQKSLQFAWQGIQNPFDDPEHRACFYDLVCKGPAGNAVLETAYLKVDGYVVATSSGVFHADIFSLLLTSVEYGPTWKYSPETLLLHFQIEEACRRGLDYFDMSASDASHKCAWCDIDVPLFDSAIAFDERGYLITLPLMAGAACKRVIGYHRTPWDSVKAAGRLIFGRGGQSCASSEILPQV